MSIRQGVIVVTVLIATVALITGTTVGIEVLAVDDETDEGIGQQVSSFTQSTAVDVNSSVESGMWAVALNQSDAPEEVIEERIEKLEERLAHLENRSEAIDERFGNESTHPVHTAQAVGIHAEIHSLQSDINDTERVAMGLGVNATKLETLRANASNMTGPEVSELARNITDAPRGPPEGVPVGPPEDAGPGNETGPPEDAGPGNETDSPEDGDDPPGDGDDPPGDGDDPPGDGDERP